MGVHLSCFGASYALAIIVYTLNPFRFPTSAWQSYVSAYAEKPIF